MNGSGRQVWTTEHVREVPDVGTRVATVIAEPSSARPISLSDGGCTASAMPLVLVKDGDDSFRDLVTLGLVANGFAVRRASDGVDGLRQLATCRPSQS